MEVNKKTIGIIAGVIVVIIAIIAIFALKGNKEPVEALGGYIDEWGNAVIPGETPISDFRFD